MKKLMANAACALILSGVVMPMLTLPAQAQMTMHFSAPFISNSGIVGATANNHFFTIAVTGYPLESLIVTLPDKMQLLDGAKVMNQAGQEIPSNITLNKGNVTINFPQPIEPNTYLTVRLSGVVMDRTGGTVLYRIHGINKGLPGTLPIGTAMIRLPAKT